MALQSREKQGEFTEVSAAPERRRYPVDLPALDEAGVTSASEQYLSSLESTAHYNNSDVFQALQTSKVAITASNVRRVQLFEDGPDCTLLALHRPDDPTQVVALYLHEDWWCVDDVLRTSSESRSGLLTVRSLMERVIVFLLSQVLERSSEEEALFSPHPRTESCKLLWRGGEAVGFYTIKHKGSLCDSWNGQGYLLPVLDTVLVRKRWRRRGFGHRLSALHICDVCAADNLETPTCTHTVLASPVCSVCRRFLQQHKEQRERLYEVEAPGCWTQRRNIWLKIQLGRCSLCVSRESSSASASRNEDDSSQKASAVNSKLDSTSFCTGSEDIPPPVGSSMEQIKPCDSSQEGRSPSSKISETGCNLPAHTDNLNSEPPTRPTKPLNTIQSQTSKSSQSAESGTEKSEGGTIVKSVKRIRRF
ncbi:protein FAM169B-like [Brachionichthys hirsutus]|uniref:protein FAM169B-like n=1 Tax=Brachionichthys hirsutus TaxID=412623 RepID=UPI003604837B